MTPRTATVRRKPAEEDMERLAALVRDLVRAVAPELKVQKKWGQPWYVGTDLILVVGAFTHHVGIEFWRGTTLRDPSHLLEGTGKNLRHVKVRTTAQATSPALLALVREAVRLDSEEEPRRRTPSR